MDFIVNWLYATSDFLDSGGPVLKLLAWVIFLYWLLIFERLFFLGGAHRHSASQALNLWVARPDLNSWSSVQIRDAMLSRLSMAAQSSIPVIKTLVALCPLLGLLGTVTGMIAIFDVMALKGTGNARSMAEGVSRATIPTMAGMVAALAGVFGATLVGRKFENEKQALARRFRATRSGVSVSKGAPRKGLGGPLRVIAGALLATAVTIGLLSVMQILIDTGKGAITKSDSVFFVDFVRVPKEETIERKERKVERPRTAEAPPEFDTQQDQRVDSMSSEAIAIGIPAMDSSVIETDSGFSRFSATDGEYLPIVKVQAIYPRTALMRGLEGYVLLEFTVTTTGSVRDPVVLESTHKVFERPAKEAALKFKYKPRVVDGQPIEVAGVINQITFEILDK